MGPQPVERNGLLDVAGAAAYLGVTEAFIRRLVLEKRIRYYKLGKFVRFRPADLDAFVDAGRHDPVEPWVHAGSTLRRAAVSATTRQGSAAHPLRSAGTGRGRTPAR